MSGNQPSEIASDQSRADGSKEPQRSVSKAGSFWLVVSLVALFVVGKQSVSIWQAGRTLERLKTVQIGMTLQEFRQSFPEAHPSTVITHKLSSNERYPALRKDVPRQVYRVPRSSIKDPFRDLEDFKFYFRNDELVFWAPDRTFVGKVLSFEDRLPKPAPIRHPGIDRLRQRFSVPGAAPTSPTRSKPGT